MPFVGFFAPPPVLNEIDADMTKSIKVWVKYVTGSKKHDIAQVINKVNPPLGFYNMLGIELKPGLQLSKLLYKMTPFKYHNKVHAIYTICPSLSCVNFTLLL